MAPPIPMRWTGDGLEVLPGFRKIADRHYVVGEVYPMAPHEDRSQVSHNHEFAWVKEAWQSLPEHLADEFPTPEHLRKRALVAAGYHTETIIDAGTKAAALRVAAYVKADDGFAVVVTRGPMVVVRKAKSQSRRAMNKAEFQASKAAILDVIAGMIGVEPAALAKAEAA